MSKVAAAFNYLVRSNDYRAGSRHTTSWGLVKIYLKSLSEKTKQAIVENLTERIETGKITLNEIRMIPLEMIEPALNASAKHNSRIFGGEQERRYKTVAGTIAACAIEGSRHLSAIAERIILNEKWAVNVGREEFHEAIIEKLSGYMRSNKYTKLEGTTPEFKWQEQQDGKFTDKFSFNMAFAINLYERGAARELLNKLKPMIEANRNKYNNDGRLLEGIRTALTNMPPEFSIPVRLTPATGKA